MWSTGPVAGDMGWLGCHQFGGFGPIGALASPRPQERGRHQSRKLLRSDTPFVDVTEAVCLVANIRPIINA
jgi:hypothetical protein